MERRVKINKDRLNSVARELTDNERQRMSERRKNRHWITASSAIAAKIKRQLRIKNITQLELAQILGITPANVTRYLNGKTNFELKTLVEIERAIGVHIIDRDVIPSENKGCALNVNVSVKIPVMKEELYQIKSTGEDALINLTPLKGKSKELYIYG